MGKQSKGGWSRNGRSRVARGWVARAPLHMAKRAKRTKRRESFVLRIHIVGGIG